MKNAPCAKLGIRIRPKIREKPDDNRNSRPPKATLFSVWMIQNCHCIGQSLAGGISRTGRLLYRDDQRIATVGRRTHGFRQTEVAADDVGPEHERDHLVESMAPA